MKNCTVSEQSMGKRRFSEYSTITPKHLKAEILVSMKSNLQQDIEDTVKMIIVHVMACVLFIASSASFVGGCFAYVRTWTSYIATTGAKELSTT